MSKDEKYTEENEFNLEQMEAETQFMLRLRYLNKNNTTFEKTEGGFVSLTVKGDEGEEFYSRIKVLASFPFAAPRKYISIREANDKAKEIGVIKDLDEDVSEETAKLLIDQMAIQYFMPVIKKIHSIKDDHGFAYWDCDTDHGRVKFVIRMNSSSVIYLSDTRLLITDLDDNRFEIPDFKKLTARELKKLDLFL